MPATRTEKADQADADIEDVADEIKADADETEGDEAEFEATQVDPAAAEAEISVAWWAARLALLRQIPSATAPRALALAEAYAWLTSTTQAHGGSK